MATLATVGTTCLEIKFDQNYVEFVQQDSINNAAYQQIHDWISQNPSFYKTTNEYSETSYQVINHGCTHIGVIAYNTLLLYIYIYIWIYYFLIIFIFQCFYNLIDKDFERTSCCY